MNPNTVRLMFYSVWFIFSLAITYIVYLMGKEEETRENLIRKIMNLVNRLIKFESKKKDREKKKKVYYGFEKILISYIENNTKENKQIDQKGKGKVINY